MISISSNFFYTVALPVTLWFFDKRKTEERDADVRWRQGKTETDLIGETAFMQGLYSVLNGDLCGIP